MHNFYLIISNKNHKSFINIYKALLYIYIYVKDFHWFIIKQMFNKIEKKKKKKKKKIFLKKKKKKKKKK